MKSTVNMRFPSIEARKGTFLPGRHWPGHELCFFLHDIMAKMLVEGQRAGAFHVQFQLSKDEVNTFNKADDVFQWLALHRGGGGDALNFRHRAGEGLMCENLHLVQRRHCGGVRGDRQKSRCQGDRSENVGWHPSAEAF
jgi:hypothetical protein